MIDDTIKPLRLTLKELVEHYEGFLRDYENRSVETRGTYQRALREFIQWFPVDKRFEFRVRDVERYKRYLVERKRLQNVSVATYMTALRRFCKYLIDIKVLDANPARRVVGGRRPSQHSRTFLTYDEVDKLLSTVDISTLNGARDLAIIRLMLDCALSEHEILLADVGDVRTAAAPVAWSMAVQCKGRRAKDERATLPETARAALSSYLDRRFADGESDESAPLFASMSNRTSGARLTARGIRAAVTRWLEESGVKGDRDRRLTPFSLRHTSGMMMVDNGATVEEVMRRMRIEWQPTVLLYFKLRGVAGRTEKATETDTAE